MGAFNIGSQVMGGGFSAGQVSALQGSVNSAVTAAGTTLATATDLTAAINIVTTATVDQGVSIQDCGNGDSVLIYNDTSVSIKVYPEDSSSSINQLVAGTAFNLASNTGCFIVRATSTQFVAFLSA